MREVFLKSGDLLSNHRRVFLSHSRPTLNEIKNGGDGPGVGGRSGVRFLRLGVELRDSSWIWIISFKDWW